MTINKYWPGSYTWEEIVAIVRALPDRIEPEDIGTVATIAGMLGVFGFPEGSEFSKKIPSETSDRLLWDCQNKHNCK